MVTDKIRKVSIKGVKLKSESFFSISFGVLELWRKTLGGGGGFRPPPGPDRVKGELDCFNCETGFSQIIHFNVYKRKQLQSVLLQKKHVVCKKYLATLKKNLVFPEYTLLH